MAAAAATQQSFGLTVRDSSDSSIDTIQRHECADGWSIVFGNVPAAALLAYGMYFISILATMIIAISSGAHGLALFDNDFLQPPATVVELRCKTSTVSCARPAPVPLQATVGSLVSPLDTVSTQPCIMDGGREFHRHSYLIDILCVLAFH